MPVRLLPARREPFASLFSAARFRCAGSMSRTKSSPPRTGTVRPVASGTKARKLHAHPLGNLSAAFEAVLVGEIEMYAAIDPAAAGFLGGLGEAREAARHAGKYRGTGASPPPGRPNAVKCGFRPPRGHPSNDRAMLPRLSSTFLRFDIRFHG